MTLLDLYQSVDPAFMPDQISSTGQLFVRRADDKLAVVAGIVLLPDLPMEKLYPAELQFCKSGGLDVPNAKEQSLDGLLTQPIWGVQR